MRIAVMQPYIFPYMGYYQLVSAVDKFAVFDDVNFISRGWINRNRILVQGEPHLFTIPLVKASRNKLIYETEIQNSSWPEKLIEKLRYSYSKAPYYAETIPLISGIICGPSRTIDSMAFESIERIARYLDMQTEFIRSTRVYANSHLKGQERIIDICCREKATVYINPTGGRALYSGEAFSSRGISLCFIEMLKHEYKQFANKFHPDLSIIDVLMFCGSRGTKEIMERYRIVQ
jgi:hypothetical protein